MTSLGEAFPQEQARLRQCLQNGREIGAAGVFYCNIIEEILRRADQAVMKQDLPAMITIFQEMKDVKE